ncbi:hypothetical protein PAHAL_8G193800 [Panicum hallii]|uniref:Uncharacterized protein n=1 Tax=Panicum hallii TaxID=206008 RepID=A0A2T8I9I0_9POAL|nr:hypothetical protein PAHAL_8G193800 [Panicum hallii]
MQCSAVPIGHGGGILDHVNQRRKEEGVPFSRQRTSPLHYHYPHHTALAVTSGKEGRTKLASELITRARMHGTNN